MNNCSRVVRIANIYSALCAAVVNPATERKRFRVLHDGVEPSSSGLRVSRNCLLCEIRSMYPSIYQSLDKVKGGRTVEARSDRPSAPMSGRRF